MPDLTRTKSGEKSVGTQLQPIIQNVTKYNLEQLKHELTQILKNPDTLVSRMKAAEYTNAINSIDTLSRMQRFITNIYMAAANMSIN